MLPLCLTLLQLPSSHRRGLIHVPCYQDIRPLKTGLGICLPSSSSSRHGAWHRRSLLHRPSTFHCLILCILGIYSEQCTFFLESTTTTYTSTSGEAFPNLAKIGFKRRSRNFNWERLKPAATDAVKKSHTRATVPRRPPRVETGTGQDSEGQQPAGEPPELGNAAQGQP